MQSRPLKNVFSRQIFISVSESGDRRGYKQQNFPLDNNKIVITSGKKNTERVVCINQMFPYSLSKWYFEFSAQYFCIFRVTN